MKIAITGCDYGLGKNLSELLSLNYEIVYLNEKIEKYTDTITDIVKDCDVFINCEYKDKIQTVLFEKVFDDWKYKKRTIVNILSSALVFDGPNKKYMEDKRDLENKTLQVRTMDKETRIINVYPNTLESSKTVPNQKLTYTDVSTVIKFALELPQDIEIFEIGVSKTKLKIETTLL